MVRQWRRPAAAALCAGCVKAPSSPGSAAARALLGREALYKKHSSTPCREASPPRRPLPAPTARPLPPLSGPAWKGSKARLPELLKLFCSPFPRLQQQWSPTRESGSRGASPGLAPAAAQPAPRTRPPSVTPAPGGAGPRRLAEARDQAASRGPCPGAARPAGRAQLL